MEEGGKSFSDLGLKKELVEVLVALGYEAPTPIQERTIPRMIAGGDLIGQAQTGTGKTAAFALPILQAIDPSRRVTQALVLAPTRELAMQVAEAIHSYAGKLTGVSVLPVYGGAPIVPQLKRLSRGAHIVVGTPGRLIDHLERKSLDLSNIRVLVLDEADEMLKMGFSEEVDQILASIPDERQIALFSATLPDEVLRIAKRHLRKPERIEIEHRAMTAPAIEQRFINVSEGQKLEVLTHILELEPAEAVLIFRRTKTGAAELAEKLEARGFAAVAMHGDMSQPLREAVIRRLRAGQVEIVVATDVAARGLDVEQIEHVINYDVPYDVEAYVHRIGRTGRAGRKGVATMFITPRERRMMREIERFTNVPIKPMKLPTRADLAAKRVAVFKDTVRKTIQEGDLDMYLELVEQLVDEGPFDMAEVAAAAARIANGSRSLVRPREEELAEEAARAAGTTPRAPKSQLYEGTGTDEEGEKTVRLVMSVGKDDGIRPADVVGSIANEAGIPGRDIGPIEILDEVTYVGIPQRFVDLVIEKVGTKKFRGRTLNLHVAGPNDAAPPPRREAVRSDRAPRTVRPPAPRAGKGPDRSFAPRSPRAGQSDDTRAARPPARPGAARTGSYSPAPPRRPAAPRRDDTERRGPSARPPARSAARPAAAPKRYRDSGPPTRDSRSGGKPFYSDFKKGGGPRGKKPPR
jgi:ATP-dependent RNA helicase DeaD